ncbi:hypothetical protein TcWFU_010394 [Taenia crassiceps]|uniref:Uncharacterized protein n=1 Tax=Taenia crassiceps TaxID=6207 RepID=A0ABR4QNT8_9CEST
MLGHRLRRPPPSTMHKLFPPHPRFHAHTFSCVSAHATTEHCKDCCKGGLIEEEKESIHNQCITEWSGDSRNVVVDDAGIRKDGTVGRPSVNSHSGASWEERKAEKLMPDSMLSIPPDSKLLCSVSAVRASRVEAMTRSLANMSASLTTLASRSSFRCATHEGEKYLPPVCGAGIGCDDSHLGGFCDLHSH